MCRYRRCRAASTATRLRASAGIARIANGETRGCHSGSRTTLCLVNLLLLFFCSLLLVPSVIVRSLMEVSAHPNNSMLCRRHRHEREAVHRHRRHPLVMTHLMRMTGAPMRKLCFTKTLMQCQTRNKSHQKSLVSESLLACGVSAWTGERNYGARGGSLLGLAGAPLRDGPTQIPNLSVGCHPAWLYVPSASEQTAHSSDIWSHLG